MIFNLFRSLKLRGVYFIDKNTDKLKFIETFNNRRIPLYDLKFTKNGISFSSPLSNREKIFAISDNMCYNVKEIGYKGRFAFLAYVAAHVGLFLAFTTFIVFARINDGYIGKITYLGDGLILKNQIENVLEEQNVVVGKRFPVDLNYLSKAILTKCESVEFVAVKKYGKRLVIEAVAVIGESIPLNERKQRITSPVGGVVRRISRYGGTAVVSVGDKVNVGDLLIDGFFEKDGVRYETDAVGDVEIAVNAEFVYKADGEGREFANKAKVVAEEKYSEYNIISIKTELTSVNTYTVSLTYVVLAN